MYRKSLVVAFLLAFVLPVFPQASQKKDPQEEAAKLHKEAIAFLRETMSDVGNLRTLENRISFSAEIAGLMWYSDEHEAKVMFTTAIADFRELITRLDQQMNAIPEDDDEPGRGGMFGDATGRARLEQKYRVAMGVRQQVTTSIAEHDPDFALSFYYDSATSNLKMAERFGGRDTYFEFNLLGQIADKNAGKATQYGIRSLDNGLQYNHAELLRKIYEKDPEKGIEFGSALLGKARSEKLRSETLYAVNSILNYGAEVLDQSKSSGKKPVFSRQELRDLAEALAQSILSLGGDDISSGTNYVSSIERFAPARAAQIRAKIRKETGVNDEVFANYAANTANRASNRSYSNSTATFSNAAANTNYDDLPVVETSSPEPDPKQSAEEKLMNDVGKIGKNELPKEERDRVVAQARKILMQTRGRDRQIMGLSMLAAQVARSGDKQLAAEIMRDAETLVNPNPKHYQDFILTWMLASGYAESNPDRAFPILEDAIGRANDVIQAAVRVGEFIDVSEEMISDGEVQVGAFGGAMLRGLTKELGIAEATIGALVKADFAKTKALTNRFDRPEVRVLAKMIVLRAVLGKKPEPKAETGPDDIGN